VAETDNIRNVVLLGHGGSGKTSLAEAILFKTGTTSRLGSVEEKTSICDFYDEEKEHQHSIASSVVHVQYGGKLIHVVDTPGYPDFMGPAIKAIPVAETAVVVLSATAGIETNTRKFFHLAEQADKPRILVVNKIDADNIDLPELIRSIQETFGPQCRCANLPSADKASVIDCLANTQGDSPVLDVGQAHTELIERIVEVDDGLMESYLGGEEIPADKIAAAFVRALQAGTVVPIVFTHARKLVGVPELLDLIVKVSPSPAAAKPVVFKTGDQTVEVKADPAGPLAGLVFRIGYDPKSNMKYSSIRIFSGTIQSDSSILRNDERKGFRPGHILRSQGGENQEIASGQAGDIITLAKIEDFKLGDVIHDGRVTGRPVEPPLPDPMFSLALEPAARGDEQKISGALERLCDEDPCFKTKQDRQTKELVVYGLGEMHLRVMLEKLEKRFKLPVKTKEPKIPYKETITTKAEGHYRHKKQTGGAGQFAEVHLRVEPLPTPTGSDEEVPEFEFGNEVFGGAISAAFIGSTEKGVRQVLDEGVIAGYPVKYVKAVVYDGKMHPVDSKDIAFQIAGRGAFREAFEQAGPVLLEPIMLVKVTVPEENMGDIMGDMNTRRGRVLGMESEAGRSIVTAEVPLAEIQRYSNDLRSMTAGRGVFTMDFLRYERVPAHLQTEIVAQAQKEKEEAS